MWWRVPGREVFIAVGDQRRKRVHMVRVLYHRDFIRLDKERHRNKQGLNVVAHHRSVQIRYIQRHLGKRYGLVYIYIIVKIQNANTLQKLVQHMQHMQGL